MQQLREVIQDLAPREQHGVLQELRPDAADTVACPECGLKFVSLKSMRQHRASKHKIKVVNTQDFHPEVHSLGGLPQCSGCRHKFRTWCALKKHIEQGSCRTPHFAEPSTDSNRQQSTCEAFGSKVDAPSESGALRHMPGVQQLIQESGWTAMVQSKHAENMKQHCCLCGRWIVDATALKRHIKGAHKALWCKHQPQLQSACKQLQHTLKRDQPCQYCGRVAYNRHYFQCCVIFKPRCLGSSSLNNMSTASELTNVFGHLMPSLAAGVQQQASLGKRTSSPTGGLNKRHKQARRAGHRGHKKLEDTEEIITLMARIVIQHEDQLGLSRMDSAFTLFMEQTGPTGVLSNLYQAGVEWNQKREDRGVGNKLQPLRTTLLTLMVMELVARLEKLQASKKDKIRRRQQGWLNEDKLMLFQAWDPEKKRLTASTDLEPMTIEAVLKTLWDIIPLISPDHVLKFHAQRPLKGMSEAENKAVFNLEISLRAPAAHQLYGHVMRLAGSSCWQIIGTQVGRDTQRRSGAVQALQRLAYGTSGGLNQRSMLFNNSC